MTKPCLESYGLDFAGVSRLLHRQGNALLTDQFVARVDNCICVQVNAASKGLRAYYSTLEKEFEEVDLLREHVGGMFFEQGVIQHRLENDPEFQSRYQVYDGFTRDEVIGRHKNKADVEFILKDRALGHY